MEELTGKQFGPYQIVDPLGEGGMAAVYKAYQPNMERYVALKVLPQYYARDPEFTGRFRQEARLIASLQHPHILPVHDFGEDDGYTYLVMPFIEGGTLGALLSTGRPLPLSQVRRIVSQVGDALDYAHSRGIIHRDIKPSNVLLDERGNCLLTDFGVAKMVESNIHFTKTGGIVGTPAYMSPEQSLGQTLDRRSDIYSLGVLLYEMATGRPPYQAETPVALLLKHAHEPLPPPQRVNPDLPEAIAGVILKSLAKDPADRYETVGAMVRALQAATDGARQRTARGPAPAPEAATVVAPHGPETTGEAARAEPVAPSRPDAEMAVREATRRRRPWLWIAAGAGLLIVACIALVALSSLLSGNGDTDVAGDDPAEEEAAVLPEETASENGEQVEAMLNEAEQAWADGNLDHAVGLLSESIAMSPETASLYCTRGLIYGDSGDFLRAAEDLEECRDRAQEEGEEDLAAAAGAHRALAQARREIEESEDLHAALAIIDEELQATDTPAWLICERGQIAFDHYANDIAIEDLSACLETVDDEEWHSRARLMLAAAQTSQALEDGRATAAMQHAQEWAELAPDDPAPHCHMGDLYFWDLEEWDAALEAYDRCIQLAPNEEESEWARLNVPLVEAARAIEEERFEEALAFYDEALLISPDSAFLYCERADLLLFQMEEPDRARAEAEECLHRGADQGTSEWAEDLLNEIDTNY